MGRDIAALFSNVASLAIQPLRERGLVETARSIHVCVHALRREREEAFDRRYGTDTQRRVNLDSFFARGDDVMPLWRYFATLQGPFRRVLNALDVAPEGQTFVDLGCGKGRAMMMASDVPFRRIVGVELSRSLLDVARRNLHLYRSPAQRCTSFEVVHADAAVWTPPLEQLVLYLFQPFPEEVMAALVNNVAKSLQEEPREITIAYLNPLHHRTIVRDGVFSVHRAGAPQAPGEFGWTIYKATTS